MFNQMQKTAGILLCVKLVGAVLLNQFIVQTDKQTNTRRTRLYLLVENWQFTQYRRKEEITP
jgi:hypothetical protein